VEEEGGGGEEEEEEEEVAILSPPPPMVSSTFIRFMNFTSMSGKNRQLVTNEPVEFGEEPVEVGDFRRISYHFEGIYGIYLKCIKLKPGRC
jgi:hypothetical protein